MAVTIVNVNNITFSIDGVEYLKNFMSVVYGDKVEIVNVYDSTFILKERTIYSDYTIDGGGYASAVLLQADLSPLLFNRYSLGIETRLDDLESLQTNLSYGESYINKYKDRVVVDGATYFPNDGGYDYANMREIGIDQDMSLMLTPSAVKAGTLYNVKPQALDFTVVRAGTNATYIDEDGVRQTALANVPRINYIDGVPSILTEPTTTNLYTTPDVLTTQNVTTTATPYTVSFEGTGTITFSGTHTGSLVGTGANDRVEITFTPTAGTLTSTVTGSVTFGQIEALSYQTSYVIGTRNADQITAAGDATTFNSEEGVLYVEISALVNDLTLRRISITENGSSSNRVQLLYTSSSNTVTAVISSGAVIQASLNFVVPNELDFIKTALKWKLNDFALWIDGVEVGTDTSGITPINLNTLDFNDGTGSGNFYGNTKSIKVFKTALTDSELTSLTT